MFCLISFVSRYTHTHKIDKNRAKFSMTVIEMSEFTTVVWYTLYILTLLNFGFLVKENYESFFFCSFFLFVLFLRILFYIHWKFIHRNIFFNFKALIDGTEVFRLFTKQIHDIIKDNISLRYVTIYHRSHNVVASRLNRWHKTLKIGRNR